MTDNQKTGRPLLGVCVMVTRPAVEEAGDDPLTEQLRTLGAAVVVQPAIWISPPADWRPVDEALTRLPEYDWLVFSSANGVRYLLERIRENGDCPDFCSQQKWGCPPPTAGLAANCSDRAGHGRRTGPLWFARRLGARTVRAEGLAEALEREAAGRRFLLARASRGREVLAERLAAAGAIVEQVVVYASSDVERPDERPLAMLRDGKIDWVTVTSPAIARSLARLFGDDLPGPFGEHQPVDQRRADAELGYHPAAEAAQYTLAGLAAAMVEKRCFMPLALWERVRG